MAFPKRRRRERKFFGYTYDDISVATGLSVSTIKKKRTRREFDMENLRSVALFIAANILDKAAKPSS